MIDLECFDIGCQKIHFSYICPHKREKSQENALKVCPRIVLPDNQKFEK